MIAKIFDLIETWKCKRGIGIFRHWNREDFKIFHSNIYKNGEAKNYIEQIKDGVIDSMMEFVGYPTDFIDNLLDDSQTQLITFFHNRIDEKGRKFEGCTLSFFREIAKKRFDKIDLVFEDIAVDKKFDGEVNQVRLYISPLERYLANDYDLLYWDSSDKKSLEIFQTAYKDNIYFFQNDRKTKKWKNWKLKYFSQFYKSKISHQHKTSSFKDIN